MILNQGGAQMKIFKCVDCVDCGINIILESDQNINIKRCCVCDDIFNTSGW